MRLVFLVLGWLALTVGTVGIVVPLLPTVPFYILAAFLFARGSPRLERKLLEHPTIGPHIRVWRDRGAISRRGKRAALITLAASATLSLFLAPMPWSLVAVAAVLASGAWLWTRPEA